ncbi:capsid protein [Cyclovirus PK5034]|uniref:Capsid protein n=1 Tax=Cyclovirus PK5034 TaxID=742916 RepID=D4N3N9_9CIRC|nr:capsid protein [Cyclovirus PK5034]ADD62454.1 capsid protein [Cyclovirus PK5034]
MAYRRRRVYRRKPVRRLGRRRRVYRRRHRRSAKGKLLAKFTKVTLLTVEHKSTSVWPVSFKCNDFKEFERLKTSFEYIKFYKVVATVYPLQNVSNNSTSMCPCYAMAPWHTSIAMPKDFEAYMSLDRAKMYRQTQVGRQVYVPSTQLVTDWKSNETSYGQVQWRPELKCNLIGTQEHPNIQCGAVAFQGNLGATDTKSYFSIKLDVYCKLKGQNTMIV